jgi:hypothetical protein
MEFLQNYPIMLKEPFLTIQLYQLENDSPLQSFLIVAQLKLLHLE